MTTSTPLDLSLSVSPASSTGAQMTPDDQLFQFGEISIGGAGASWVSGVVRDVIVAGIAGIAIKFVWDKIK